MKVERISSKKVFFSSIFSPNKKAKVTIKDTRNPNQPKRPVANQNINIIKRRFQIISTPSVTDKYNVLFLFFKFLFIFLFENHALMVYFNQKKSRDHHEYTMSGMLRDIRSP